MVTPACFMLLQVSVRAEARAVGMRVLVRAAAERAREEAAARERRALAAHLPARPLEGAARCMLLGDFFLAPCHAYMAHRAEAWPQ